MHSECIEQKRDLLHLTQNKWQKQPVPPETLPSTLGSSRSYLLKEKLSSQFIVAHLSRTVSWAALSLFLIMEK